MNLMMLLEMAASGFGDRVAVQNGGEKLTYTELFGAAGAAAARDPRIGCRAGGALRREQSGGADRPVRGRLVGTPLRPDQLSPHLDGGRPALLSRIEPAYLVTDAERVGELGARPGTTGIARDDFIDRLPER